MDDSRVAKLLSGDIQEAVEELAKIRETEGQFVIDAYFLGMLRGAGNALRILTDEVKSLREQLEGNNNSSSLN